MKILRAFSAFFASLILYLFIPLLGWGIDDLSGFLKSAPHFGYAVTILVFAIVIGVQAAEAPLGIKGSDGIKEKIVPRQRLIRIAVTVLLYMALFFLPFMDRRSVAIYPASETIKWIGMILFLAGMLLVYLSGISLGRLYSKDVTIQENHKLVTSGVYSHIRHPRYLGGILSSIGLSLLFRSWIGGIGVVIFVILIFIRIQDEEKFMHQEFGLLWESYCSKTWKMIPFLY